jgi:two-component system sensor histidine kinase MprB
MLRRRLTLLSALAVGLTVVVASAVAYVAVRGELRRQTDASLRAEAARAVRLEDARLFVGPGFPLPPLPPRSGAAIGYAQLIGRDGRALLRLRGDAPLPVGGGDRAVAVGRADQAFSDRHVLGVHLRVLTTALPGGGALQLARALTSEDSVLQRLRIVLLALIVGCTVVAAALSRAFSRRVLTPLADLTATAEHIEATGDLGRRIHAPGQDEVGRLARRFNAMLDRLAETQGALAASAEQQRRLVADASHELRTPVTSLRTNLEVLREEGALPESERRALVSDVVAQVEELGALIGDIIELARDGEPPRAVEEVRVDELVAEAVARAQRHAPQVRFQLDLEPWTVEAAPDRLGRAVNNLLDNAARHGRPDGPVEVRVRGGELSVRDHGPGVAAADAPHVFDRFYRGAAARGRPGSGLGLAIVRQVAEAHGGSVSVEAPPDGGALFRLSIPGHPPTGVPRNGASP